MSDSAPSELGTSLYSANRDIEMDAKIESINSGCHIKIKLRVKYFCYYFVFCYILHF